jgi:hypothetical protein
MKWHFLSCVFFLGKIDSNVSCMQMGGELKARGIIVGQIVDSDRSNGD